MSGYLVLILPGIIAALLYSKWSKAVSVKKILWGILFYTVGINLLISGVLWLMGVKKFNLFEASMVFKLGWFLLGTALAVVSAYLFNYYKKVNWLKIKRILPSALFLAVTYTIFAPSSLFLQNINEFYLNYITIVPVVFFPALLLLGCITFAGYFIGERYLSYYTSLIFGISLSIYIQMNFLNSKLPTLDGTEVDWTVYRTETIISTLFWILCVLGAVAATCRWKQKAEKATKYVACFLSAVQMVSLVVLLMTNKLDPHWKYGFSKEGEFLVGSEENIVVFIVDCLQSSAVDEYLTSDAYAGQLDDFTFFDNAVSGGAPTAVGMPLLLTGIEHDPMQDVDEYRAEIWQETELFDDMLTNGYDIRFYTTRSSIPTPFSDEEAYDMVGNYAITRNDWIENYMDFGKQFYKLVNFYTMPQILKERYWLSTDSIINTIYSADEKYTIDNLIFFKDMQTAKKLVTNYDKAFRLYHLYGVHKPYIMNENLEEVEANTVSEQQQLQGVMKELSLYMDMMKNEGVYDASTIVILGDHGQHEDGNAEINPAVLIKSPYESHSLVYNSAPVHFRNVVATMAKTVIEDYSAYGPSVYDITQDSDVERLHTIRGEVGERIGLEGDYNTYHRLIIPENARTGEYKIWNPHEINRISYKIGDKIDFTMPNSYAEKLDYRLYKEDGAAVASNELSICFALEDYHNTDLELHFIYSGVYNDSQKIRVYANGKSIEKVICMQDNSGEEKTLTIPQNAIEKDELIIRMVFPNAVTPNQLDRNNPDTRILSVAFDSMWLEEGKSE